MRDLYGFILISQTHRETWVYYFFFNKKKRFWTNNIFYLLILMFVLFFNLIHLKKSNQFIIVYWMIYFGLLIWTLMWHHWHVWSVTFAIKEKVSCGWGLKIIYIQSPRTLKWEEITLYSLNYILFTLTS